MPKGIPMTIIQEKGGVGKSLATMNIANFLCRDSKVLIIDLDGQAAGITYYLLNNRRLKEHPIIYTVMDVFQRPDVKVEDIIIPVKENLDLIPANTNVANLSQSNKISIFKNMVKTLKEIYDYILIDVTPSPTWAHLLALSSPGQKILPIINADASSLKALISLHDSVAEVQETTNPTAEYLGIIVNRYDSRTNVSREIVAQADKIAKSLGTTLFETKIHQSVTLSEQTAHHKSIFEYAPGSKAAKDYEGLCIEILKRLEVA